LQRSAGSKKRRGGKEKGKERKPPLPTLLKGKKKKGKGE